MKLFEIKPIGSFLVKFINGVWQQIFIAGPMFYYLINNKKSGKLHQLGNDLFKLIIINHNANSDYNKNIKSISNDRFTSEKIGFNKLKIFYSFNINYFGSRDIEKINSELIIIPGTMLDTDNNAVFTANTNSALGYLP